MNNIFEKDTIAATDSYKWTHHLMYPPNTEAVYSYFESRDGARFRYTVFFGLQYLLKRYLEGFVVNQDDINGDAMVAYEHFGAHIFNREGWQHIYDKHGGQLPLRIKAVPEGTPVPTGNVLMTVENTDPECYWLTNAVESLLTHVWYPSTVATLSRTTFEIIAKYLDKTAETRDALPFMLHDFGYRGASSHESAAVGGMAHLVNGLGTDTIPAMLLANEYYDAPYAGLGYSVPATEHSVMTAESEEGEFAVIERLLEQFPGGIFSMVSDSYNIYRVVNEICTTYKDRVLARDGKLVIRPDSLTDRHERPDQLVLWIVTRLWKYFGGTINKKGYRVLDPHVGAIWGDGIDPAGIDAILNALEVFGFSAENVVFGMGGGLLQKVDRDTQRFAFKCSAQKRDGRWHDVYKKPLDASKASKRGRLALVERDGQLVTVTEDMMNSSTNMLETVFENGKVVKTYTFDEVRANAAIPQALTAAMG